MSVARAGPKPEDVSICRGENCRAEIVFLRTSLGRLLPVNVIPVNKLYRGPNAGETAFVYGEHEPHHSTCPDAGQFRRAKR